MLAAAAAAALAMVACGKNTLIRVRGRHNVTGVVAMVREHSDLEEFQLILNVEHPLTPTTFYTKTLLFQL